jgi:hypothetical protein
LQPLVYLSQTPDFSEALKNTFWTFLIFIADACKIFFIFLFVSEEEA